MLFYIKHIMTGSEISHNTVTLYWSEDWIAGTHDVASYIIIKSQLLIDIRVGYRGD